MKTSWIFLTVSALALGNHSQAIADFIRLDTGPQIAISNSQSLQVMIIDGNGNAYEQTAYYNPNLGGIDLDTNWAGPNASIYFPSLGTGYLWYNGYWVDQSGYYWNGSRRIYLNDPNWHHHWTGYWQNNWQRHPYHWNHENVYWQGHGQNFYDNHHEDWQHHHPYDMHFNADHQEDRYRGKQFNQDSQWRQRDHFKNDSNQNWQNNRQFESQHNRNFDASRQEDRSHQTQFHEEKHQERSGNQRQFKEHDHRH